MQSERTAATRRSLESWGGATAGRGWEGIRAHLGGHRPLPPDSSLFLLFSFFLSFSFFLRATTFPSSSFAPARRLIALTLRQNGATSAPGRDWSGRGWWGGLASAHTATEIFHSIFLFYFFFSTDYFLFEGKSCVYRLAELRPPHTPTAAFVPFSSLPLTPWQGGVFFRKTSLCTVTRREGFF